MRSTGSIILEEAAKYEEVNQRPMGMISEIEPGKLLTSLPGRLA